MGKYLKRLKTQRRPKVDGDLRLRVLGAENWRSLEAILQAAAAAYERGEITTEAVEQIASMAKQRSRKVPEDVSEPRLGDLFTDDPNHRCRSHLLGVDLLFVADDAEAPTDNELPVYRVHELRLLVGMSAEALRKIHAATVALDGEVVETGEAAGCSS